MSIRTEQEKRLRATIDWARKLRADLGPLQRSHGDRIHFRPASTGISMVGLLPDRPQRGKSGLTNLSAVFDAGPRGGNCLHQSAGRSGKVQGGPTSRGSVGQTREFPSPPPTCVVVSQAGALLHSASANCGAMRLCSDRISL